MVTVEQTTRRTRRVFYGWLIVAAAMGIQALQGALLSRSFGAYIVFLQQDFGWSRAAVSAAFSLQQIESGLLGPIEGWLVDRFGPRAVMRVGVVLFGLGFMVLSRIDSLTTFYLAFMLMALGNTLGGFLPITVTIVNWFARRRATAMGIMQTGMGIGGLLAPLVAWSLNTYGWRATAFASGAIIIAVGLPLTQIMRHKPEPYGYLPDGDDPNRIMPAAGEVRAAATHGHGHAAVAGPDTSFTVGEAVRTPAFWLVSFGHGSALLVVSAVQVHLVAFLNEALGYSVQKGASVIALLTAITMAAQVGGGFIGDRVNRRVLLIACMLGHAVALLTLAYATAFWMVVIFALLHGLAWGVRGPLMQAIRADYFGRTSFGKIMGVSNTIVTTGSISGPLVAGILADRTGSYQAGFTILALLAGLGSVFWLLAQRPGLPQRLLSEEGQSPSPTV